jgi:hypothetical protein
MSGADVDVVDHCFQHLECVQGGLSVDGGVCAFIANPLSGFDDFGLLRPFAVFERRKRFNPTVQPNWRALCPYSRHAMVGQDGLDCFARAVRRSLVINPEQRARFPDDQFDRSRHTLRGILNGRGDGTREKTS